MPLVSFVSVPMTDAIGKITRVVRIPVDELSSRITPHSLDIKSTEKILGMCKVALP